MPKAGLVHITDEPSGNVVQFVPRSTLHAIRLGQEAGPFSSSAHPSGSFVATNSGSEVIQLTPRQPEQPPGVEPTDVAQMIEGLIDELRAARSQEAAVARQPAAIDRAAAGRSMVDMAEAGGVALRSTALLAGERLSVAGLFSKAEG